MSEIVLLRKCYFVTFTFSGPLGLWDSTVLFGNRVALNPGLGSVMDAASAIISHEHTQYNRVCCFETLDAVFPKDLFSDYFELLQLQHARNFIFYQHKTTKIKSTNAIYKNKKK